MKLSKSAREYMETKLAHVDHDRSRPVSGDDIVRLLRNLESPEEEVRAGALREVCPCRMTWEDFDVFRKPALKLRKDPSPLVRKLANHIEEDASEVASLEALRERQLERKESANGRDGKSNNRRVRHGRRPAG